MSFDLMTLVIDRTSFRGKPLHFLTEVIIAEQTIARSGRALATRKSLIADTGMADGRIREVLRDLVRSGEVIGTGGGRGNIATYAVNVAVLQAQPWRRPFGNDSKRAGGAAGLVQEPAGGAAGLVPIDDENVLPDQRKHAAPPCKHAARPAPPNKEQGVNKENKEGEHARIRDDNSAHDTTIAAHAVAHVSRTLKNETAAVQKPEDVEQQTWDDWQALRKAKRAPITATVLKGARVEAEMAGMPLEAFLCEWAVRGSQGLKADWLKNDGRRSKADGFSASLKALSSSFDSHREYTPEEDAKYYAFGNREYAEGTKEEFGEWKRWYSSGGMDRVMSAQELSMRREPRKDPPP